MEVYRFVWVVVTAIVSASALVYDVATGGLLRLAVFGPGMALFGGMLVLAFVEDRSDRWTWVRRAAVWSGAAAVAADAFVAMWGDVGLIVGLGFVVTSPTLLLLARHLLLLRTSRRASGPPESMSTRDLLRRWEWTTAEVLRTTTPASRRLVLVEERRRLLDELQARDPSHFDDWLVSAVPDRR